MKINLLDAHDRLNQVHKQADYISQGCQDCINNRPGEFGQNPFYIYAHCRTADNGVTKRMIWVPRLSKPKPETNSMLFKYYPKQDVIKIIWMIPAREMWDQYVKGNLTQHQIVIESIHSYRNHRTKLGSPEPDDLSDKQADDIYRQIAINAQSRKMMDNLWKNKNNG